MKYSHSRAAEHGIKEDRNVPAAVVAAAIWGRARRHRPQRGLPRRLSYGRGFSADIKPPEQTALTEIGTAVGLLSGQPG